MQRRTFLHLAAAAGAAAKTPGEIPNYRIVTRYQPGPSKMPGKYPGQVVAVRGEKSIDPESGKIDVPTVQEMMRRGMLALTGQKDTRDAWAAFIAPSDVVGIKVNCSGAPQVKSSPEVVAEIVKNLTAVGVAPERITIYERFPDQVGTVHYDKYLPAGVNIFTAEGSRGSILSYDPHTYVEVNFFGEEDTRSNLIRQVSEKFTKIINVPNMKDHGAAGVTGCLKNIAYGNFSNVARSHSASKTNTYSFIGTLASVEPLRTKTVLHVMDGLAGVWHGGPFVLNPKWRFFPKQMMFGTDPVAIDRQLLDIIEAKRKEESAPSVWDRSPGHLRNGRSHDPQFNQYVREPGHIEYASTLGLGVYDQARIRKSSIQV